ncbi:Uncharacterised protein [Achromobacter denitrificans]|nr:Uncharacterised protein [Achromobacter denitrificans]
MDEHLEHVQTALNFTDDSAGGGDLVTALLS